MATEILPDLSSRELQAICAIAECGSFMSAAITLNVSQPALTRTVQRVEKAVGLELFRRSTRRVEVTPAGQEFISLATRVLADLRISFGNMREITDEQRGIVTVSTVMSVAYTQLPRIIAGYRQVKPKIELQVREGVHGTVSDDVRSGSSDLGVTYIDDVASEFSTISLSHEVFHVVMPSKHPLAKQSKINLDDLRSFPLISLPKEAQTRRLLDSHASVIGVTLSHAVTVNHFATLVQCVYAGVGIAIVPSGAVPAALHADLVTRPLMQPKLSRTIGVILLKDRTLTPSARGFLSHLQADWKHVKETKPRGSRAQS
ncbi:LysR family transcriptional regulator [Ottowia thiooxydans]|uniref:LysR family transcriptional regulator n=1 Tax=Ottowia thiooxydans TaxID=219182 RepID=UPI0004227D55|nr:LysR family transcriptional regulator [Ottowia thiooxydans]